MYWPSGSLWQKAFSESLSGSDFGRSDISVILREARLIWHFLQMCIPTECVFYFFIFCHLPSPPISLCLLETCLYILSSPLPSHLTMFIWDKYEDLGKHRKQSDEQDPHQIRCYVHFATQLCMGLISELPRVTYPFAGLITWITNSLVHLAAAFVSTK